MQDVLNDRVSDSYTTACIYEQLFICVRKRGADDEDDANHLMHVHATRHARLGRGDDHAARDADALASRRNPSRGFRRDLGASARSATPSTPAAFHST